MRALRYVVALLFRQNVVLIPLQRQTELERERRGRGTVKEAEETEGAAKELKEVSDREELEVCCESLFPTEYRSNSVVETKGI